jgi:hypothetical protein
MGQVPIWTEASRVEKTLKRVNAGEQATLSQFEESRSKPFYLSNSINHLVEMIA